MVGPWTLALHHDHLQYIHHVHLMQRGQYWGITTDISSLRTIGTELSKKKSMVKKRMQRNHEEWHLAYGSWNITEIVKVCKLYMQHTICTSCNTMIYIFLLNFLYHGCHELLLMCFCLCLMNVFKAWMVFHEEWRFIPYNSIGFLTTSTYK